MRASSATGLTFDCSRKPWTHAAVLDELDLGVGAEQHAGLAEELGLVLDRDEAELRRRLAVDRDRAVGRDVDVFASNGMTISPPPSSSSGWPSMLTIVPSPLRVKAPARVSRSPSGVITVK